MHTIFFDPNAGTREGGFMLWFDQSRSDIDQLPAAAREGATVLLRWADETETIEHVARLTYDKSHSCWKGVPIA